MPTNASNTNIISKFILSIERGYSPERSIGTTYKEVVAGGEDNRFQGAVAYASVAKTFEHFFRRQYSNTEEQHHNRE